MREIAHTVYASTEYPGVNVGLIVLPEGAIAVDAPTLPQDARAWRQRIMETAGGPILYVVLTDAHPDRVLSAGLLEAPIVAARAAYERAFAYSDGFWRAVVEGWARRFPEAADDLVGVSGALPELMLDHRLTLHKGGMDVTVERIAGASPGSVRVCLPEQGVLFVGDTLVVDTHPFMDAVPDSKAWLNTLKSLRRARFSKTTIVPGRGPICDQSATRPLSEYIALVRRRVRSWRTAERMRVDKAAVVTELLPLFPVPDGEHDLVQRRIKTGLERVYEEL
jgi:glyoxylase-like metal-dependent hydrolase (beta-lactamase superfamily II)